MKLHIHKLTVPFVFSLFVAGCQQSAVLPIENTVKKTTLPIPCKGYTTPPIQNKDKIKDMLFKEGKLNKSMSEEQINHYINQYIKRKSNPPSPCKPVKGLSNIVKSKVSYV